MATGLPSEYRPPLNNDHFFLVPRVVVRHKFDCTGGPRYSRGLRSGNIPRIPKPRITREHCYGPKVVNLHQFILKYTDNRGKTRG